MAVRTKRRFDLVPFELRRQYNFNVALPLFLGQNGLDLFMCRSTAGPLLAMVGVAGTAAGVAIAIVRERIDRRADTRAARQAAEEQDAPDVVKPDSGETDFVEDESGASESEPVETEPVTAKLGESKPGDL